MPSTRGIAVLRLEHWCPSRREEEPAVMGVEGETERDPLLARQREGTFVARAEGKTAGDPLSGRRRGGADHPLYHARKKHARSCTCDVPGGDYRRPSDRCGAPRRGRGGHHKSPQGAAGADAADGRYPHHPYLSSTRCPPPAHSGKKSFALTTRSSPGPVADHSDWCGVLHAPSSSTNKEETLLPAPLCHPPSPSAVPPPHLPTQPVLLSLDSIFPICSPPTQRREASHGRLRT